MNPKDLKIWMIQNEVTQAGIARDLDVSLTLVGHTVHGREKNRRVLAWLMDNGCPEDLLDLTDRARADIETLREQEAA